ncbi:hypothetical protein PXK00_17680, partial [Phaeobacter sp. QD34_3]|nr:hypothetical protein [Phaeobacter sp. QD34_3]MDE4138575.1 hypothetical protein [Phaeobacter sp. QD34_24]
MKPQAPAFHDESDALFLDAEGVEQSSEDDLWFLPGPMEEEPGCCHVNSPNLQVGKLFVDQAACAAD